MRTRRSLVGLATVGLVVPLTVSAMTSSAVAASCGNPVWDFDHDGNTDAVSGGIDYSQLVYGDGSGGKDRQELGLRIPDVVDEEYTPQPEAFASISLAQSAGDGDFCSLIAVGVPGATVDGHEDAGLVHVYRVVPGSDDLDSPNNDELLFTITQANDGLSETEPADGARFGASLAAYDQTDVSDGPTPLAIGAPGETVDGKANAGSVAVLTLTQDGDVASARRATRAPGKGVTESSALGTSLAAADGLVVAGMPGRTVSGRAAAGAVLLVPTDPSFDATEIHQATKGVQGGVEPGDRFGHAVAATRNASLNRFEVGIGIPGEDVGSVKDAGQITTLRTTRSGSLSSIVSAHQNSSKVPGSVETGDQHGYSIAVLPTSGASDWLVGVPFENIGSTVDAGQIQTYGESKNRAWDSEFVFDSPPSTRFRFGEVVVGPRGDRGPLWLALNPDDDSFAGLNLPGFGDLEDIVEDVELQGAYNLSIGG